MATRWEETLQRDINLIREKVLEMPAQGEAALKNCLSFPYFFAWFLLASLLSLLRDRSRQICMLNYLYVGLGGALGSVLRFWISNVIAMRFGEAFPFGTIFVNVTGSFAIGFLATVTAPNGNWAVPLGGRV